MILGLHFIGATVDIAIWSTIEPGLAITAGSLACLRPLVQITASKLGISAFRTPHAEYTRTPVRSAGRKGPKISGPFSLVSFGDDGKVKPSSQEYSLEVGKNVEGHETTRGVQTDENDSQEELNARNFDAEIAYPPRPYAKSESLGGFGRYVHK